MTREDILHMAQEAGWETPLTWDETDGFFQRLERFAALVAAAEREACAKVCIEIGATKANSDDGLDIADLCAATIRARGEK